MARLFSLLIAALMLAVACATSQAEEFDPLLPDSPANFEQNAPAQANEAIDIDGEFAPPPKYTPTEADRLRQEREALQKKNEEMIRAKIEDIRLQNEIEIGKKMDRLLDQTLPPEGPAPANGPADVPPPPPAK